MDYRDVVESSIEAYTKAMVTLILDGWSISPINPGDAVGFGSTYTVTLYRDASTIANLKRIGEELTVAPKMSQAESLAKARAVRKARSILDVDTVI